MRAREFIFENEDDIGSDPTANNLKLVLDNLRSRYEAAHEVPKIRVRSLINMVRSMPGSEMFNVDNLMQAYDEDENLKNLITDIKKDPDSGVPYVFLKSPEEELLAKFDQTPDELPSPADDSGIGDELPPDVETPGGSGGNQFGFDQLDPEQTVDQMSKRALKKRQ